MKDNDNSKLLKRAAVYVVVFVLGAVSWINFTNSRDANVLDTKTPDIVDMDATKAVEPDEEVIQEEEDLGNGLPEYMVLGELDLNE